MEKSQAQTTYTTKAVCVCVLLGISRSAFPLVCVLCFQIFDQRETQRRRPDSPVRCAVKPLTFHRVRRASAAGNFGRFVAGRPSLAAPLNTLVSKYSELSPHAVVCG
ncbi:hypothetical protein CANARDRAFT_76316 [[Candida] arabinofermentans NRRL YB-2248]|uniref:Uncharacterized protein n=1 Tax=[Candida] arabinofermentans NRRL YB-2248 TaxID=983967 RepID=A0A1E4SWB8_9ASCO|nr:hypothetical protein CANARDRAFT_76316 [[Candida] arabinofermentans NRRL YB-2248]